MSASPAWRRLRRLEAEGVVARHVALLDRRKLGLDLLAYVNVSLTEHSEAAVARFDGFVAGQAQILGLRADHRRGGFPDEGRRKGYRGPGAVPDAAPAGNRCRPRNFDDRRAARDEIQHGTAGLILLCRDLDDRLHLRQHLGREVALDLVPVGEHLHGRHLGLAAPAGDLGFPAAAGLEGAAGGWVHGAGDFAFQHDALARDMRVGDRHGGQERLGVGVVGGGEDLFGRPISTTWPRYMTMTRSLR